MHIVVHLVEQVQPPIQPVVILQATATGQVHMAAMITVQNVVHRVHHIVVVAQLLAQVLTVRIIPAMVMLQNVVITQVVLAVQFVVMPQVQAVGQAHMAAMISERNAAVM